MSIYDEENLSQWHSGNPVHVGVYEVDKADKDGRAFSLWDGKCWHYVWWERIAPRQTCKSACEQAATETYRREGKLRWRGLREKP